MTYNDWLEFIKKIENAKLTDDMISFVKNNQVNENYKTQVIEQLDVAMSNRLTTELNSVRLKVNYLFEDQYLMDMQLVIFKKNIKILYGIAKSGIFPPKYEEGEKNLIRSSVDQIFDILCDKANEIDYTGVLGMTVKNNKIRWDKEDEL